MLPKGLRTAFVVHFVADVLFALPLFFAPRAFLTLLGWHEVDPLATRLVAAALFGIGIESLLGRNAAPEAFKAMLNLKVIWSATATIGLVWSQLEGGPAMGWAFVAIFAAFHVVWLRYRLLLEDGAAARVEAPAT
jgi:hypothetical protein